MNNPQQAVSPAKVEISSDEYMGLLDEKAFLDALRQAGVDNWDGYEYACDIYREGWDL